VYSPHKILSHREVVEKVCPSLLNRFTKVYLDTLSRDDLQQIVKSRFPLQSYVKGMVAFNTCIHGATVDGSTFGRFGTLWECKLSDIFRWRELFDCTKFESKSRIRFARDSIAIVFEPKNIEKRWTMFTDQCLMMVLGSAIIQC
jgi:midasin (ATPase involved in ribosome maturation)